MADEYDLIPDTTEEYDQLHDVSGVYNLPKREHKTYHSYDIPQYMVKEYERQARAYGTAKSMQQPIFGQDVGNKIISYYIGARHYTPLHASYIQHAIEGKIRHNKAKAALQMAKRIEKRHKPRAVKQAYEELAIA